MVAIRLPIKCGKGRAAAGGQSFGGSDTDSDTQSTKSAGSAHRVAARTFKKSFKGKAVAIVKPFSSVSGEKRSPGGGPVKEQKSGSKSDLLNLLYDFKSDEESSAGTERQRESSQLLSGSDVSGVTGIVTTAKSPNCHESDTHTVVELVTPPPPTGVSASAIVRAEISSAAAAATTAKQIRGSGSSSTVSGGAAKPSVVARRLKFGGAPPELKAVRVRVEKLQQASAPSLYAAAAPDANQPNPASVSGKYSAGKPEDGVGGEETIKKEPAEACSVIGSQPASVAEIKSEPVVDSVGSSSASDCSTEEKKDGEVKVEVEPTAAIPPDIKPGKVFLLSLMS